MLKMDILRANARGWWGSHSCIVAFRIHLLVGDVAARGRQLVWQCQVAERDRRALEASLQSAPFYAIVSLLCVL